MTGSFRPAVSPRGRSARPMSRTKENPLSARDCIVQAFSAPPGLFQVSYARLNTLGLSAYLACGAQQCPRPVYVSLLATLIHDQRSDNYSFSLDVTGFSLAAAEASCVTERSPAHAATGSPVIAHPWCRGNPSSGMVSIGCLDLQKTQRSGCFPASLSRSKVGT